MNERRRLDLVFLVVLSVALFGALSEMMESRLAPRRGLEDVLEDVLAEFDRAGPAPALARPRETTTPGSAGATGSSVNTGRAELVPETAAAPARAGRVLPFVGSSARVAALVAPAAPASSAALGMVEFENACPNYRGGGPCSKTPHVRWQCGDREVAALKSTWSVYEVWCMEGANEVRVDGAWPAPASGEAALKVQASAESVAAVPLPARCDVAPLEEPTEGRCGWYKARAGDVVHGESYRGAWGAAGNWASAEPGVWHLVANHLILHTTLLPCSDARVARGRRHFENVFCVAGAGELEVSNLRPERFEPLSLMVTHDRIRRGSVPE